VHVEPEHLHAEAAQLHMHVGKRRQFLDACAPVGEHLVALALVAAEPDRAADMVEADRGLREGARQLDDIAELRMIDPGIEAEPERRQVREAFAHLAVAQQAHRPDGRGSPRALIRIHRGDVADAAEPAAARHDHRLQHLLHG
jgi:hypothetical protein